MHITIDDGALPVSPPILKEKRLLQAKKLWSSLKPEQWPIDIRDLPPGTALVGGAVRDALLGRLSKRPDLDLVVPQDALNLTRRLAKAFGGTCVVLDEARDMARLVHKEWTLDFACLEGANLIIDLQRRDYSINAIALTLGPNPHLVDPTGGLKDLEIGQLVAVKEQNLLDDPLRLLRGLRLMAEINLTLDPETQEWIQRHHQRLKDVAPERIQAELQRLVAAPMADVVLPLLQDLKLLVPWQNNSSTQLPTQNSSKWLNNDEKCLALPLARLTHLLSNEGLSKLRFSRKQQQRCIRLRHWQDRDDGKGYETLPEHDRLQLHIDLQSDLPALILKMPEAFQQEWLLRWRNDQDPLFHPSPPLDGYVLQSLFHLPPGPTVGALIKHLCLEKAFKRISDKQGAFQAAEQWVNELSQPRCD